MPDLPAAHDPPGVPLCGDRVPRAGCKGCARWPVDEAYRARVAEIRAKGRAFKEVHAALMRRRVLLGKPFGAVRAAVSDLAAQFAAAVRKRPGGASGGTGPP